MRRLLVFVHIPKTAGTTLRTVLGVNEPGSRSRGLGNVFKGGGGVSKGLIDRLRKDQGPDLRRVALIRGHFPLGIRDYLPKDRELACFTFLREPGDRLLSHYFAIREYGRGYGLPPLPEDATLEEALASGHVHDNLQTRMLSGLPDPFGEVDDAMLEQAKDNLREGLVFFGLTERFDESLVLAKRRLGFTRILYKSSSRVNTTRPRGRDVPVGLRRAAETANRYDIELYRYAEALFEAIEDRQELEFQVEVAALSAAKVEGDVDLELPPPPGYHGDEQGWRLLLDAKTTAMRLEWERTRHRIPQTSATEEAEALANELTATRSTVKKLEREIERREAARSRARKLEKELERMRPAAERAEELEQEVERLAAAGERTEELEQEVEQLTAATARVEQLEKEIEQLTAATARMEQLEKEIEQLTAATARMEQLEQEVEQLTAATARVEELEKEIDRLTVATARVQELEQEVERLAAATARVEELEQEVEQLTVATARTEELERDVERLSAAAARAVKLEQQVDRLKLTRLKNRALQEEVERLKASATRTKQLESEVERLKAASWRAEELEDELEQQVERLRIARSRKDKLEQKLERLKVTAAGRRPEPRPVPPKT